MNSDADSTARIFSFCGDFVLSDSVTQVRPTILFVSGATGRVSLNSCTFATILHVLVKEQLFGPSSEETKNENERINN